MREAPLRLKLNFIPLLIFAHLTHLYSPLLTFTYLYPPLLIYLHADKLFM